MDERNYPGNQLQSEENFISNREVKMPGETRHDPLVYPSDPDLDLLDSSSNGLGLSDTQPVACDKSMDHLVGHKDTSQEQGLPRLTSAKRTVSWADMSGGEALTTVKEYDPNQPPGTPESATNSSLDSEADLKGCACCVM